MRHVEALQQLDRRRGLFELARTTKYVQYARALLESSANAASISPITRRDSSTSGFRREYWANTSGSRKRASFFDEIARRGIETGFEHDAGFVRAARAHEGRAEPDVERGGQLGPPCP